MWPGQQPPGGEQNPQDKNPYQTPGPQPGFPPPNPYQQPGYAQPGYGQQQPNPYQQPGPQPGQPAQPGVEPGTVPQWNAGGPPGAPRPPGDNRKRTTVIAIGAAVAVVAAAVVTGVVVLKDDDKENVAQNDTKPSASASAPASTAPSPSGSEAPLDNPRSGGEEVKPVIDGWKVVTNQKRHDAFDVPSDWMVESPSQSIGFEDEKGKGLVLMSGTARYKKGVCRKNGSLGAAGTKGAQGAKSMASAAKIEAENWLIAGYDLKQTGKLESTDAKPFKSDHGLTGYTSTATVTGVTKSDKCDTDGKSFTVTYKDSAGDLATWVLHAATGTGDDLSDDTIKKIMSSLRPLKSS
ncbi:hypothetical protein M1P56_10895 [Streptomyces sp. HU2014]|uniref:Membrane protein n=1 Tax=Streptomyces albireticuli TaxID=1940 RepID=A0A1Z2LAM4_9ACTN|nr:MULTISPECIES: hypothetical protein [Streptomyces]ARZ71345.1 membrane protein [Streptomyces albireticuli]UQI44820.1 hypothetical protein M1P56_10895 [Streptomyces sp. HU2014]